MVLIVELTGKDPLYTGKDPLYTVFGTDSFPRSGSALRLRIAQAGGPLGGQKSLIDAIIASLFPASEVPARTEVTLFGRTTYGTILYTFLPPRIRMNDSLGRKRESRRCAKITTLDCYAPPIHASNQTQRREKPSP
jgi:hypothetical protein